MRCAWGSKTNAHCPNDAVVKVRKPSARSNGKFVWQPLCARHDNSLIFKQQAVGIEAKENQP